MLTQLNIGHKRREKLAEVVAELQATIKQADPEIATSTSQQPQENIGSPIPATRKEPDSPSPKLPIPHEQPKQEMSTHGTSNSLEGSEVPLDQEAKNTWLQVGKKGRVVKTKNTNQAPQHRNPTPARPTITSRTATMQTHRYIG